MSSALEHGMDTHNFYTFLIATGGDEAKERVMSSKIQRKVATTNSDAYDPLSTPQIHRQHGI